MVTDNDISWIYNLSVKKYPKFDAVTTEGWFRNIVLKQPLLFLAQRTHNAYCVSMLSVTPWMPADFECNVVFICADDNCEWEAVKLMRASIAWARNRKCRLWRVSSDTETDLAVFAKRLGAQEISPRFTIRLDQ
jgi:hypothetical protein